VKDPDTCTLFALARPFATDEELAFLRTKYTTPNAGFGYGHAKEYLFDILNRYIAPYRKRREHYLKQPELIEEKFTLGAEIMNARLEEVMKKVRRVTGVR
jgi:tryptophanyl-tRNA synthetase